MNVLGVVAPAALTVGIAATYSKGRQAQHRAKVSTGRYPFQSAVPKGEQASNEQRQAAVQQYFDSLLGRSNPFKMLVSSDVTRVENGLKTAFSGTHLMWDAFIGLQYNVVKDIVIQQWTFDPEPGIVRVQGRVECLGNVSVTLQEDFLVPASDGLIHSITAHVSR